VLAYRSLPTECTIWLCINYPTVLLGFHKCLLVTPFLCPISARVSLISSEYPTWCRYTLKPCCHDLNRAFVNLSCLVIQEKIKWRSAPQVELRGTIWFDKVLCHPCTKGKVTCVTVKSPSFQLFSHPSWYTVKVPFIISCSPTHLRKSRYDISFKGGGL
jgi:hypothetical protein